MKKPVVYTYAKCSTCRKAVKWLEAEGISFTEKPIRETPPSKAELKRMLAAQNGELKKLFNTSGGDYREMKLGSKLPTMTETEAFDLLHANGNLVKRPFLLTDTVGLVGFKEEVWAAALR
ncbi:arsenate reductase family protein [Actomonas aquatica]|uniref:Arsenate reductase family protein n=1 Tax=Actomonas aquatica TaxID=2866162 RepID=A0ABZ1CBD8_9BACT|nr:arsenate reductase family protein [Opitutus sp. WL0086]WRQ88727.1 arsenate reductase family protein [Opitutus sp. WL0086]